MKKIYLLLILVFFTSCSFNNKVEIESWNTGSIINENSNESFDFSWYINYSGSIDLWSPQDYELTNVDLLDYRKAILKDEDFFKKDWDAVFFYVFRNYVYGDNYDIDPEISSLISCLKGDLKPSEIKDSPYLDICKWENIYSQEDDINNFHIKDSLLKFKNILNDSSSLSCNYFLWDEYNYPNDLKHYTRLNDYILCRKMKDIDNYSIQDSYYYYMKAYEINECSILNDSNLEKLCNEEFEINPIKIEK